MTIKLQRTPGITWRSSVHGHASKRSDAGRRSVNSRSKSNKNSSDGFSKSRRYGSRSWSCDSSSSRVVHQQQSRQSRRVVVAPHHHHRHNEVEVGGH